MRNSVSFAIGLLIFTLGQVVQAEVVKLPDQEPQVVQKQDIPQRGMVKSYVSDQFGQPSSQNGPVGNPPIYRWDYADYSVFFEGDYVLHSVVHSN